MDAVAAKIEAKAVARRRHTRCFPIQGRCVYSPMSPFSRRAAPAVVLNSTSGHAFDGRRTSAAFRQQSPSRRPDRALFSSTWLPSIVLDVVTLPLSEVEEKDTSPLVCRCKGPAQSIWKRNVPPV